jgi:mannosyl-oligosaccharide alpha-1,2-mannosidase
MAGYDQYRPVSNVNQESTSGGLGWMIVDSLDTLMIMNLTSKVHRARQWISTSLQYDQDRDVNTFETTIRMLGGLLSAHYLSTKYPDLAPLNDDDVGAAGEDLYIEKAADLAERLLGAFESPSGIPWSNVNLNTSAGVVVHFDEGATSISEAGSVQLEFKYLAKLTGEAEYWKLVEKAMKLIDYQEPRDGLVPSAIHPDTGRFKGDSITLGNKADSYYGWFMIFHLHWVFQANLLSQNISSSSTSRPLNRSPYTKRCGMNPCKAFASILSLSPRTPN